MYNRISRSIVVMSVWMLALTARAIGVPIQAISLPPVVNTNFIINTTFDKYPFMHPEPLARVIIRMSGTVEGDADFENSELRSFPVITTIAEGWELP